MFNYVAKKKLEASTKETAKEMLMLHDTLSILCVRYAVSAGLRFLFPPCELLQLKYCMSRFTVLQFLDETQLSRLTFTAEQHIFTNANSAIAIRPEPIRNVIRALLQESIDSMTKRWMELLKLGPISEDTGIISVRVSVSKPLENLSDKKIQNAMQDLIIEKNCFDRMSEENQKKHIAKLNAVGHTYSDEIVSVWKQMFTTPPLDSTPIVAPQKKSLFSGNLDFLWPSSQKSSR